MRLLLMVLSLWAVILVGLVVTGAFVAVANEENYLSTPMTLSESIIATLLAIPTLILVFLVMVSCVLFNRVSSTPNLPSIVAVPIISLRI